MYLSPSQLKSDSRYAFAVGLVRTLEAKLLNQQAVNRLLEARDMQALQRELGDTGYGVLGSNLLNFETGLHQELKRVYELIADITPEPELINLLRLRYDFHNLKAGYKAKYFSERAELALSDLGVVDKEQLMQIMEQDDLGRLPPCLSRIAAQVVAELGTSPEGATVDMAFDKALYSFLYQEAVKHKSLFLQGLFQ